MSLIAGKRVSDGKLQEVAVDDSGEIQVDVKSIAAGTALIGKVGIDQTTPGTTNGVQIVAALPAGTNTIGKMGANSGVDIGDVDITSIASGTNIIGKVGIDQTTPGTTNGVQVTAAIPAGEAHVGQVGSNAFAVEDTITRPANTTTYGAQKAMNCSLTVTAGSYASTTVTLTSNGHPLAIGDWITVTGINTGFTWTSVDGTWQITAADTNTFSFVVSVVPTGTTPASATVAAAVSKLLRFNIGRTNSGIASLRRVTVNVSGTGVGALRLYLYNYPVGTLVDQSTFTILTANDPYRMGYIDLYPVTEGSGSTSTIAVWTGEYIMKCQTGSTYIYGRLCKESSDNSVVSVSGGVIRAKVVGYQM